MRELDVREAYLNLLGREPEPGAVEGNLLVYSDIWAMVKGIMNSREYRNRLAGQGITAFHKDYLVKSFTSETCRHAAVFHKKSMYNLFSADAIYHIFQGNKVNLGIHGDYRFALALSPFAQEGELEVTCSFQNIDLYTLAFSFVEDSLMRAGSGISILVARMQGSPPSDHLNAFSRLSGLSAQVAAFSALRGFASALEIDRIIVVSGAEQLSSNPSNVAMLTKTYDGFAISHGLPIYGQSSILDAKRLSMGVAAVGAHARRRLLRRKKQELISHEARACSADIRSTHMAWLYPASRDSNMGSKAMPPKSSTPAGRPIPELVP